MRATASRELLSRVGDLVAGKMGLHFPEARLSDLERGLAAAARELGFADASACAQWFLSASPTKEQFEVLSSYLTVGETYLFREQASLDALVNHILPQYWQMMVSGEKYLRLWSAGCATGEEAYSLAIALKRVVPALTKQHMSILATDINERFLQKARQGIYSEWSFREAPDWLKRDYFAPRPGNRYEISQDVKQLVNFSYLNLAEDAYPALLNGTNGMDVIFCRNVLMYLTPAVANEVIGKFKRCLVYGGWLVVSLVEHGQLATAEFTPVQFDDVTLFRKERRRAAGKEPSRRAWAQEGKAPAPASFPELPPQPVRPGAEPPPPGVQKQARRPERTPRPSIYREALELFEQGRYEDAEAELKSSFEPVSDKSRTMALLARIYANRGRLDQALSWCQKAIAADNLNSRVYYLQATILQEQGQLPAAADSLKTALYLDQGFVLAHMALGRIKAEQGQATAAERHFASALKLLDAYPAEAVPPEAEGMTAGRLRELIAMISGERRVGRS